MEVPSVHKRTRVSYEQKQKMFEYMLAHADLARNRVTGSDAARRRTRLLAELASILNSCATGATKSPEKWWKCWQDWRNDTKAKAAKLKKSREQTGGGPPAAPLSAMEEALVTFVGREASEGLAVPDTLETETPETPQTPECSTTDSICQKHIESTTDSICQKHIESVVEKENINPLVNKPMQNARQRLEDGIEAQAVASELMANSLDAIAIALTRLATAIENMDKK